MRFGTRTASARLRQPLIVLIAIISSVLALGAGAAVAPRAVSADATFDSTLYNLINQDRAQNGLPPLALNGQLSGVAETSPYGGCGYTIAGRAQDMINRDYFSHTLLNCGTQNVFNILQADGVPYSWAGENIAWASGISDPVQAAQYENQMYMNSPEHRANILNANYTAVGVGSWATASGQTYQGSAGVWVSVEDFSNTPTAAAPPPVYMSVFAAGGNPAELSTTYWNGSSWMGWSGFAALPGGLSVSGDPASVNWRTGWVDVAVTGSDHNVYLDYFNGSGWMGWGGLGSPPGGAASAPAAVSMTSDTMDVIVRGAATNHLYYRWWSGSYWTGWADLGAPAGEASSDPSAVSMAGAQLDVVTLDGAGRLEYDWWSGTGWSGWTVVPGVSGTGSPATASMMPGTMDIVARDASGDAGYVYWSGTGWSPWTSLRLPLSSKPSATVLTRGTLDVAGTQQGSVVYDYWSGSAWQGPNNLGSPGSVTSAPSAVAWIP